MKARVKKAKPSRRVATKALRVRRATKTATPPVPDLQRELNEAREQLAATSEILRVISSSPGDLKPVFATMLEKAVSICDATFGNIYRWDGEALRLVASRNTRQVMPRFAPACHFVQAAKALPGADRYKKDSSHSRCHP